MASHGAGADDHDFLFFVRTPARRPRPPSPVRRQQLADFFCRLEMWRVSNRAELKLFKLLVGMMKMFVLCRYCGRLPKTGFLHKENHLL